MAPRLLLQLSDFFHLQRPCLLAGLRRHERDSQDLVQCFHWMELQSVPYLFRHVFNVRLISFRSLWRKKLGDSMLKAFMRPWIRPEDNVVSRGKTSLGSRE